MTIALIWAESKNGIVGKENTLPWHLPNDLKYFRSLTQGNAVVMGRKTFESLGNKPLPNRENFVLTRQMDFSASESVHILHSVEELASLKDSDQVFVIGGAEIYQSAITYADILYRTVIHQDFDGDAVAPAFNKEEWELVHKAMGVVDEKNLYPHTFFKYRRKDTSML